MTCPWLVAVPPHPPLSPQERWDQEQRSGGKELLRRIRIRNLSNILREEDIFDPPELGVCRNSRSVHCYYPGLGEVVPANHSHLLGQPGLSVLHPMLVKGCHRNLSHLPGHLSCLFHLLQLRIEVQDRLLLDGQVYFY